MLNDRGIFLKLKWTLSYFHRQLYLWFILPSIWILSSPSQEKVPPEDVDSKLSNCFTIFLKDSHHIFFLLTYKMFKVRSAIGAWSIRFNFFIKSVFNCNWYWLFIHYQLVCFVWWDGILFAPLCHQSLSHPSWKLIFSYLSL